MFILKGFNRTNPFFGTENNFSPCYRFCKDIKNNKWFYCGCTDCDYDL